MTSVNSILSCDDIGTLLTYDNITRDITKPIEGNKSRVLIKPLRHCISIHDISIDMTDKEVYDFIDKYIRRWYRIIDIIKSTEQIYFIRFSPVNCNEKDTFIRTIKKHNPLCNFLLVVIKIEQPETRVVTDDAYLEINLPDKKHSDWRHAYLDWAQIFKYIELKV